MLVFSSMQTTTSSSGGCKYRAIIGAHRAGIATVNAKSPICFASVGQLGWADDAYENEVGERTMSLRWVTLAIALLAGNAAAAQSMSFEHIMNIGAGGTADGQFQFVEDVAFDSRGRLYVTDAVNANVQVFDKGTGKFIARFGGKGQGKDQFEKPEGIAIDKDGNIFVADYMSGYVKKFDKGYQHLLTFSDYGTKEGQNLESEFMDIADGLLYMAEAGNHRVDVFDLNGVFKRVIGAKGNGPGQLQRPEAARVSKTGLVYVTDLGNNRVQVFTKEGTLVKGWGKEGTAAGEFRKPTGLALDKQGNVYVSEVYNNRIQVFDKDGKPLASFGTHGKNNGEFDNLHGLAVDERGYLYACDTGNNRVQVFKPKK